MSKRFHLEIDLDDPFFQDEESSMEVKIAAVLKSTAEKLATGTRLATGIPRILCYNAGEQHNPYLGIYKIVERHENLSR